HDVLAQGGDIIAVLMSVENALGIGLQEFHCEMDALEVAAFDGKISPFGCSGAKDNRIEIFEELLRGIILSNLGVDLEGYAFFRHDIDSSQHELLVEFHVGNAVGQQTTDSVRALENRNDMAGAIELGGGAEPGRAGADHGDFFAGANFGDFRDDPAFLKAPVDDGALDIFNGDRRGIDAQNAGAFAGGRANAAGEIGEVIRLVQPIKGLMPEAAIDEIVPFRNEVINRTARSHSTQEGAGMTERNAAVHAARPLFPKLCLIEVEVEFVPVLNALKRWTIQRQLPKIFDKSSWFAHLFQ
ncbi:MAG: hypothetical protein JWM99_1323, partial [Verrucomicrobiales bacterium]|nr:hypothetical protein [Verrucomicrobiales bacterium]